MIPKKPAPDLIRGGHRFPAFAKPASAGEGRSDKIMLRSVANHIGASRVRSRRDFTLRGAWMPLTTKIGFLTPPPDTEMGRVTCILRAMQAT
jgi:hypothetical protein